MLRYFHNITMVRFFVTKPQVKCLNKILTFDRKRLIIRNVYCLQCFCKYNSSFGRSLIKCTVDNKHLTVVYPQRFLSTELSVNEQKLENYLQNLSWGQLESKYSESILHNKSVLYLIKEKEKLEENIKELEIMKEKEATKEGNKEMLELIEGDLKEYKTELTEIYEKIIDVIVPKGDFEDCNEIVLEIMAGVGGSEAMLFASELLNMYCGFFENRGWEYQVAHNDKSELGGVRHCSLLVSGPGAYSTLELEAGVHRVQRVPETEKGGRMHTSTVTVAVLPQPTDVDIDVKESDLKIETKRASGAGGQHVNTTDSAVRITHLPSGISVECQTDRSQLKNRAAALKRLKAKLYEREMNKIDSNIRSQRKSQIGTSGRSEKIRTYNFRDDRISDHRLSVNVHNIKDFMEGREQFETLLEKLMKWHHESQIKQFIDSLPD